MSETHGSDVSDSETQVIPEGSGSQRSSRRGSRGGSATRPFRGKGDGSRARTIQSMTETDPQPGLSHKATGKKGHKPSNETTCLPAPVPDQVLVMEMSEDEEEDEDEDEDKNMEEVDAQPKVLKGKGKGKGKAPANLSEGLLKPPKSAKSGKGWWDVKKVTGCGYVQNPYNGKVELRFAVSWAHVLALGKDLDAADLDCEWGLPPQAKHFKFAEYSGISIKDKAKKEAKVRHSLGPNGMSHSCPWCTRKSRRNLIIRHLRVCKGPGGPKHVCNPRICLENCPGMYFRPPCKSTCPENCKDMHFLELLLVPRLKETVPRHLQTADKLVKNKKTTTIGKVRDEDETDEEREADEENEEGEEANDDEDDE